MNTTQRTRRAMAHRADDGLRFGPRDLAAGAVGLLAVYGFLVFFLALAPA